MASLLTTVPATKLDRVVVPAEVFAARLADREARRKLVSSTILAGAMFDDEEAAAS